MSMSNNINPASIGAGVKVEKTGAAGQAAAATKSSADLDSLMTGAGESTGSGQLKTAAFDTVKALVA